MRRGILATAILAAWGAGLAALAQRELSRTAIDDLAEAAVRVSPIASYLLMERQGRHIGFASFTTDTVPDGLQFTHYSVRETPDEDRRVQQHVIRTSRALILREITIREHRDSAVVTVVDDSVLRVVRVSGSGPDTSRATFHPPLLVPALVPMAVALGASPSVGDETSFDVFDPVTLSVRTARVQIRAESTWVVVDSAALDARSGRWAGIHADSVMAWHVVEAGRTSGGIDAWVDEQGQLVATSAPDADHARRTAYEVAFENWRARGAATAAVAAPVDAPPLRLSRLTMIARGLPLNRLQARHAWQQVRGDTLVVEAPSVPRATSGYWLPGSSDHRRSFVRTLQVEPMIEVEEPVIAATARRLRAREPNPATVAARLVRWVADSIAHDDTPTLPDAVTTLRSRAGGMLHRVHLFTALARSAGIPVRTVRGLRATSSGFMPWAWAEAWVGGQWLPVDPAGGSYPADASFVRLLVGGATLEADLARLVGRAQLNILTRAPLDK